MADALDDLDPHVRRVDPDRWLAARLVGDAAARRELLALYALYDAWARIGEVVTQPLIGEMRLAWWREALEEVAAGGPRRSHPLLLALAPALETKRLPLAPLHAVLDARVVDVEPQPFADAAAVERYLDGTAGALMEAAAVLLDARAAPAEVAAAGRAWGWAGLLRAEPTWRARGRRWAPAAWGDDLAVSVRARVEAALTASRRELAGLPVASFPAVAYATLARGYVHGREPSDLTKRARLLMASARGTI